MLRLFFLSVMQLSKNGEKMLNLLNPFSAELEAACHF